MEIRIKVDLSGLERRLQRLEKEQVPYATALALTRTAQVAATALNAELPQYIDKPTSFTLKAFTHRRAKKSDLRAVVFAKDIQAKYLRYQVFGGDRAPNKKAQRLPSNIKLNAFGNIPRGEITKLIELAKSGARLTKYRGKKFGISSKLDLFYGDPGHGNPAGIYKRVVNGDRHILVPLIVFPQRSVHYKPRFPMRSIVQRVVNQRFRAHFAIAMREAKATAR